VKGGRNGALPTPPGDGTRAGDGQGALTEILFYHLQSQALEAVLPPLLERSLSRGWRCTVEATSQERLAALDDHLWTYADESFLPHGTARDPDAAGEPVVLTLGAGNPNGATVRFLVEGAPIPPDAEAYERIVLIFDGRDDEALAAARAAWKQAREAGHKATYWQQTEAGRWEQKA
jgi:DNA polymerase III subunit chi